MSYHTQLMDEINTLLDSIAEGGGEWRATWVAHEICRQHDDGLLTETTDADFWRHCGYTECRREVRQCINRRAGDSDEPREIGQYTLPGFKHLQQYYVVRRDNEDVGVPVHDLTDAEIDSKGALYRNMGAACYAHADELDRFKHNRRASESA
jgi:hypothetical protein